MSEWGVSARRLSREPGTCFAGAKPAPDHLKDIVVIADGSGPLITDIADALRSCGIGRVLAGPYAAEALGWLAAPARRRPRRVALPPTLAPISAIVAVSPHRLDPLVAGPWQRAGLVHLPVEVHPGLLQVGPLVIPGLSSCVRCRSASPRAPRRDGPIAHPPLIEPLGISPSGEPDRGAAVLAAAVAALFLRRTLLGDHSFAGISTDVVAGQPDLVHRYWPPHPTCDCLHHPRQQAVTAP